MYNPSGPWGAPGYSQYSYPMNGYPGSIQTLTPGQQYVPGSSIPGSNAEPTPTYGGGTSAPPYGGTTSPTVPNPSDPGSPYFPGSGEQFNTPRSGVNAAPATSGPPVASVGALEPFELPTANEPLTASAESRPLGPALRPAAMMRETGPAVAENYRYDPQYAWLEGVVSFDPADGTWNIVYSVDPAEGDEFAGHFTLADSPLARTFREGERVRLEGRVDPLQKDRFGKPTYLADRVIRTAA
jgi:hypothetical protein